MPHVHIACTKLRMRDEFPDSRKIADAIKEVRDHLVGCRFVKLNDDRRMLITVWSAPDEDSATGAARRDWEELAHRLVGDAEDILEGAGKDLAKQSLEDFAGDVVEDVSSAWVAAGPEITLTFGTLALL